MRIQASHMNLGFMQELAARRAQGENLGSAEQLLQDSPGMRLAQGLDMDTEASGLNPGIAAVQHTPDNNVQKHQSEHAPQTLGATFANEIIRRLEAQEGTADQGATSDNGQPKDNQNLRHSLGQAMDWIRERFGDETAAAAAGMVLQSTSSGVNEESLGDGLLNTLKFIDRNFGIAAGDAAIAKFNQGVNVELNEYFGNGKAEIFYAETTPVEGASATQDLNTRFFMRSVQTSAPDNTDTKSAAEKLLEDLKKELDEVAELQDLTTKLEAEFNPTKATPQAALAAYIEPPVPTEPQFTSVAV